MKTFDKKMLYLGPKVHTKTCSHSTSQTLCSSCVQQIFIIVPEIKYQYFCNFWSIHTLTSSDDFGPWQVS